eukprot:RCo000806
MYPSRVPADGGETVAQACSQDSHLLSAFPEGRQFMKEGVAVPPGWLYHHSVDVDLGLASESLTVNCFECRREIPVRTAVTPKRTLPVEVPVRVARQELGVEVVKKPRPVVYHDSVEAKIVEKEVERPNIILERSKVETVEIPVEVVDVQHTVQFENVTEYKDLPVVEYTATVKDVKRIVEVEQPYEVPVVRVVEVPVKVVQERVVPRYIDKTVTSEVDVLTLQPEDESVFVDLEVPSLEGVESALYLHGDSEHGSDCDDHPHSPLLPLIREVTNVVKKTVELVHEVPVIVEEVRVIRKKVTVEEVVERVVEVPYEHVVTKVVEIPREVTVEKIVPRRVEVAVEEVVERLKEIIVHMPYDGPFDDDLEKPEPPTGPASRPSGRRAPKSKPAKFPPTRSAPKAVPPPVKPNPKVKLWGQPCAPQHHEVSQVVETVHGVPVPAVREVSEEVAVPLEKVEVTKVPAKETHEVVQLESKPLVVERMVEKLVLKREEVPYKKIEKAVIHRKTRVEPITVKQVTTIFRPVKTAESVELINEVVEVVPKPVPVEVVVEKCVAVPEVVFIDREVVLHRTVHVPKECPLPVKYTVQRVRARLGVPGEDEAVNVELGSLGRVLAESFGTEQDRQQAQEAHCAAISTRAAARRQQKETARPVQELVSTVEEIVQVYVNKEVPTVTVKEVEELEVVPVVREVKVTRMVPIEKVIEVHKVITREKVIIKEVDEIVQVPKVRYVDKIVERRVPVNINAGSYRRTASPARRTSNKAALPSRGQAEAHRTRGVRGSKRRGSSATLRKFPGAEETSPTSSVGTKKFPGSLSGDLVLGRQPTKTVNLAGRKPAENPPLAGSSPAVPAATSACPPNPKKATVQLASSSSEHSPVWLGFSVAKDSRDGAVTVKSVTEGGPAAEAGLEVRDEVIRVGEELVSTVPAFVQAVKAQARAGSWLDVEYRRGGAFYETSILVDSQEKDKGLSSAPGNAAEKDAPASPFGSTLDATLRRSATTPNPATPLKSAPSPTPVPTPGGAERSRRRSLELTALPAEELSSLSPCSEARWIRSLQAQLGFPLEDVSARSSALRRCADNTGQAAIETFAALPLDHPEARLLSQAVLLLLKGESGCLLWGNTQLRQRVLSLLGDGLLYDLARFDPAHLELVRLRSALPVLATPALQR